MHPLNANPRKRAAVPAGKTSSEPASKPALIGAWALGTLALTAKRTAVGIVAVLILSTAFYALRWRQQRSRRLSRLGTVILVGALLSVLGAFLLILQPPVLPAGLARALRLGPNALVTQAGQLSDCTALLAIDWGSLVVNILTSFVCQFGWLTLPVPRIWVSLFGWALLLISAGVVIRLSRAVRVKEDRAQRLLLFAVAISAVGIASTLAAMVAQYLVATDWFPPQGRYLFPFISAIGLLAAWGWHSVWPKGARKFAIVSALAFLLAFDITSRGFLIVPHGTSEQCSPSTTDLA